MTFSVNDIPDLTDRVALVTGGNGGIGWETVAQLAHKGAHVYLCSRSIERGEEALKKIQTQFGSDTVARIQVLQLDLADLDSVKQAATKVLTEQSQGRLDILVANAGIMAVPNGVTKQGIEIQFGTNVVGHAYLEVLLLPLLVRTSKLPQYTNPTPNSLSSVRIVQVSSMGHVLAGNWGLNTGTNPDVNTINTWSGKLPEVAAVWARYGLAKTGNIWLADLWKEKLQNAQVDRIVNISLHPGVIATNLYQSFFRFVPHQILSRVIKWFMTPSDQGALTQLYAAGSSQVDTQGLNGAYLVPIAQPGWKSPLARDTSGEQKALLWTYLDTVLREKQGVKLDDLVAKAIKL